MHVYFFIIICITLFNHVLRLIKAYSSLFKRISDLDIREYFHFKPIIFLILVDEISKLAIFKKKKIHFFGKEI